VEEWYLMLVNGLKSAADCYSFDATKRGIYSPPLPMVGRKNLSMLSEDWTKKVLPPPFEGAKINCCP